MEKSIKRRRKQTSMKNHPNVKEVASQLTALTESVKCSICLDVMIQPARINCGHTFCTLCIENTVQYNKPQEGTLGRKYSGGCAKASCPICKKANINKRSIIPDPILEGKIKLVKDLRRNLGLVAKEIGVDLDSVRAHPTNNEAVRGKNETAKKKPKLDNQVITAQSLSVSYLSSKGDKELNLTTYSGIKTYGRKNKDKSLESLEKGKIARHFMLNDITGTERKRDISVYDAPVSDESPPKKKWKREAPKPKEKNAGKTCDGQHNIGLKLKAPKPTENENFTQQSSLSLHSLDNSPQKQSVIPLSPDNEESKKINVTLNNRNASMTKEKVASIKCNDRPEKILKSKAPKVAQKESSTQQSSLSLHSLVGSPQKQSMMLLSSDDDESKSNNATPSNKNASMPREKIRITECNDLESQLEINNVHGKEEVKNSGQNSSSSLSLHSLQNDDFGQENVETKSKSNSNAITLGKNGKDRPNQHLEEKSMQCFEGGDVNFASSRRNNKREKASVMAGDNAMSIKSVTEPVLKQSMHKKIPFVLKGNMLHNSKTNKGGSKRKNVPFIKLGNLAPKASLLISPANNLTSSLISNVDENIQSTSSLENDPDKSGIVLETETSSTLTLNTQNTNSQLSLHGQILQNESNDNSRPTADDFDDLNEDEITCIPKPLEETDDEDLFYATPDNIDFEPKTASTTKQETRKKLSQSPRPHNCCNWKKALEIYGESNVFKKFEVALHGDFGSGISGGQIIPSRSELWRLLVGCGAKVYNSVNLFTFARGVTGICIVNQPTNDVTALKSRQSYEYKSIFAASEVAVVEKQWLLECLGRNKLVSMMPFLQHQASKEELRRLDYGEDLL